jgi:hypothetical protein
MPNVIPKIDGTVIFDPLARTQASCAPFPALHAEILARNGSYRNPDRPLYEMAKVFSLSAKPPRERIVLTWALTATWTFLR